MTRVVNDPGALLDYLGDSRQRPQVIGEPARPGTGKQDLLDLGQLVR